MSKARAKKLATELRRSSFFYGVNGFGKEARLLVRADALRELAAIRNAGGFFDSAETIDAATLDATEAILRS